MKDIDYSEIFKSAFAMTWKNKFLWLFGFFMLLGSFSLNYNLDIGKISKDFPNFSLIGKISDLSSLPLLVVAGIILGLILFVMRVLSTAAIIKSANDMPVYRNSPISSIFREAGESITTLIFAEILIGVFLIALFVVLFIPVFLLFGMHANAMGIMTAIVGIAIFIPMAILFFFLRMFTYMFAVLGKNRIRASVELSYGLFRKNIKESLLMAVLLIAISILFTIALVLCMISISLILGAICFFIFLLSKTAAIAFGVIAAVIILAALVIAGSFYQAFSQVSWLLFFQKISFQKDNEKQEEEPLVVINIPDPEAV